MHSRLKFSIAFLSLSLPSLATAWGAEAHRLIAELAQEQLSPAARVQVARMLELEPGASMASVSTWADEVRSRHTAAWHYVNPPEGNCSYVAERDCADDDCVVEAINAQVAILKSTEPQPVRLVALKRVIHLVGDVHQPLHAGFKGDKGGNLYQVRAFGRGMNLHSLWDGGLIRNRAGGEEGLRSDAVTPGTAAAKPAQPGAWAVESCSVVQTAGFYPDGRFIDQAYVERWDPVLVRRLQLAAQRLAATLNDALR